MLACGLFGGDLKTPSGDCGEFSMRTASHTADRFTSLRGKRSHPACEEDVSPVDKTRRELSFESTQNNNPTMDKFWLLCGSTDRKTAADVSLYPGTNKTSVTSQVKSLSFLK